MSFYAKKVTRQKILRNLWDGTERQLNARSKKEEVTKKILNTYVSKTPKVPDYLNKTFYLAEKAQAYADKQKVD